MKRPILSSFFPGVNALTRKDPSKSYPCWGSEKHTVKSGQHSAPFHPPWQPLSSPVLMAPHGKHKLSQDVMPASPPSTAPSLVPCRGIVTALRFPAQHLLLSYLHMKGIPVVGDTWEIICSQELQRKGFWVFSINISSSYKHLPPEEVFAPQFSLLILLSELTNSVNCNYNL